MIEVLDKVLSVDLELKKEMIIVDDGSRDQTYDLAQKWADEHQNVDHLTCKVIRKENGGKGSAIRVAIENSTGELAIVQDADMEYDPNDYAICLAPILAGKTKVVYGSRHMNIGNAHSYYRYHYGGRLVSIATNVLYGSRLTDEPTCYKTFDGDLLRALPFTGNRFEWEPEITAKLLRLGHSIYEVPISYFPRHFEDGKKIGVKDGIEAILTLLKWRFASLSSLSHLKVQKK
jgi:glycosyltransferase involved in cell wall biosynthesis